MNSEDLKLDKTPLRFGKYKGKTPDEVSEIDPGWIVWAHKNVKWPVCSQFLADACSGHKHEKRKDAPAPELGEDIDDWGDVEDDCPF